MTVSKHRSAPARLALALAACAAVVWFVHLAVSYALVPASCRMRSAVPLLLVTVLGVAVGAGCAVAVSRAWGSTGSSTGSRGDRLSLALRVGPSDHDGGTDPPSARIATTGLALAGYFTFVMVLAALVPILVGPCA